jgi:hypothetical protein
MSDAAGPALISPGAMACSMRDAAECPAELWVAAAALVDGPS